MTSTSPAQAALSETNYGFKAFAYGSYATTGPVGLTSAPTAYTYIGCTRLAGKSRDEKVAAVSAPADAAALRIGAVTSHSETFRNGGDVGTSSSNRISSINIGPADGPHLVLKGLETTTKVWADRNGKFHEQATFSLADVIAQTGTPLDRLNEATGPLFAQLSDVLKSRDGKIEIPGVARIVLGRKRLTEFDNSARARAVALRVVVYTQQGEDIRLVLGRSSARIYRRLPAGVLGGQGFAATADVLNGVAGIGRLGKQPLPCNGTNGKVRTRSVAGLDLGNAGALDLGAASSKVYGVQYKNGAARAWTAGQLAGISLGSGDSRLVIKGIRGQANVIKQRSGRLIRNADGSRIASLTIGGEEHQIPKPGDVIEIPGLATVSFFVTDYPGPRAVKVTAVRIVLVPDAQTRTGVASIDLGVGQTFIKRY